MSGQMKKNVDYYLEHINVILSEERRTFHIGFNKGRSFASLRMTFRCFFFLFILFISQVAFAQTPADLAKQAQNAYLSGEYEKAMQTWQQLKMQGYTSVDYNIGNAYFRIGKKGLAKAYWLKYLENHPRDVKTRHNLEFLALGETKNLNNWGEKILYFYQTYLHLSYQESLFMHAILSIVLLGVYLLKQKWAHAKKMAQFFYGTVCIYLLSLMVLGNEAAHKLWYKKMIAIGPTHIKSEPSEQAVTLSELKEGEVAVIIRMEGEVVLVKNSNGIQGWVNKADLESI